MLDSTITSFFDFLHKMLDNAIVCTSNTSNKGTNGEVKETNGLYEGHAYSLLQTAKIYLKNGQMVMLVKIRNPWGKHEWNGDWSDGCKKWNTVSESTKTEIDYTNKNDGGFWMSFQDWTKQFEKFSICILPALYVSYFSNNIFCFF